MAGKTKKYLDSNPEQKAKHNARNRKHYAENKEELNKSRAERKKKREDLERKGVSTKGKDIAHTKSGLRLQDSSKNRGAKTMAGDKRARGKKK